VLILNGIVLGLFDRRAEIENLVEAVSTRMDLQRVWQHDEDRDGKLPEGDKERGGWVHRDDIRAYLQIYTSKMEAI
jgi:hypothetical protein